MRCRIENPVADDARVSGALRDAQTATIDRERFPVARARAACERARFYASHGYPAIKPILQKALDQQPLPTALVPASSLEACPGACSPLELRVRRAAHDDGAPSEVLLRLLSDEVERRDARRRRFACALVQDVGRAAPRSAAHPATSRPSRK